MWSFTQPFIFELGYFTWMEQCRVSIDDFDAGKKRQFWDDIANQAPGWDTLIKQFNQKVAR